MEHKTLSCEARTELGKGASRRYRMAGKIPAVVYGHQEPVSILIDAREFGQKFKTISESTIIELSLGKQTYQVLVKDFQQNLIKDSIEHIDFLKLKRVKLLRPMFPLYLREALPAVRSAVPWNRKSKCSRSNVCPRIW